MAIWRTIAETRNFFPKSFIQGVVFDVLVRFTDTYDMVAYLSQLPRTELRTG